MSKKLGKLRKWAGGFMADIKPQDSPAMDDDLRALDEDLSLRKKGIERLIDVADGYQRSLVKRKEFEDPERPGTTRKMSPMHALGLTLIAYGEQHGDTTFGQGLVKFGHAKCKIMAGQNEFARLFHDDYFLALEGDLKEVKECQVQRKLLEKRRQAQESAIARVGKSKKEKGREDLEDEAARSCALYEETLEDVQARVLAVEEAENAQLQRMLQVLDDELDFVNMYRETLTELKNDLDVQYEGRPRMKSNHSPSIPTPTFPRRGSTKSILNLRDGADSRADSPPAFPRRGSTKSILSLRDVSAESPRSRTRTDSTASSVNGRRRGIGATSSPKISGGRGSWGEYDQLMYDAAGRSQSQNLIDVYDSDDSRGSPAPPKSFASPSMPYSTRSPLAAYDHDHDPEPNRDEDEEDDGSEPDPDFSPSAPNPAQNARAPPMISIRVPSARRFHTSSDSDEPFGDHHTPIEERRDPMSTAGGKGSGTSTPPLLPPRRPTKTGPPPPTPPRRAQSYQLPARKQDAPKSPFDTTDDSDS